MDGPGSLLLRKELLDRYGILLREIEDWFRLGAAAHRDLLHCGPGCTLCCHGLFDITPLDAAMAAQGFETAPEEVQQALRQNATLQLGLIRRAAPGWKAPWSMSDIGPDRFDDLCDSLGPTPCPALSLDGLCLIYHHRPLVCRLHGLPMFEARDGTPLGGECNLNLGVEEGRKSPVLWFDHDSFEARELALIGEWAGDRAASDPEGAGTILAAVLRAGRDKSRETSDNQPGGLAP